MKWGKLSPYDQCFVDALEKYQLFPETVHQAAGQQTLGCTAFVKNLHVEGEQAGFNIGLLQKNNQKTIPKKTLHTSSYGR